MKRGMVLISLLLMLTLAAAPAYAAKGGKGKKPKPAVPDTPELPTSFLPDSMMAPAEATAAVAAATAVGQSAGDGPAEALQVVAAFLQLSDSQVQSLIGLLQARYQTVMPLIQGIYERYEAIEAQLESGAPDATTIGTLVIEIHGLIGQVQAAQETFLAGFEALLTTEEQQRRYLAVRIAKHLQPILPAFERLRIL